MTLSSIAVATGAFTAFVIALGLLTRWVPARRHPGALLPDGTRVEYPMNGLAVFLVAVLGFVGLALAGVIDGAWPVRNFWALFLAANLFSVVLSAWLWATGSERGQRGLVAGFWLGSELNPTALGVDLKVFSYRPSLIGLAILNASFAFEELARTGSVSLAMALFQAFTFIYLLLTFQFEHGMLSMFDVIEERFGFMLVWGDYALVPFFYCIPGWTLLTRPEPIAPWAAVALTALFCFGYWVFRGTNEQKSRFKANPTRLIWGKAPETVGGRLLVSGFWGIGRKLNYSGEILVYVAFAGTAGLSAPWPWLLPAWLFTLLLHRAHRDDQRCRKKYGALWEQYCARARFRMIPFVY